MLAVLEVMHGAVARDDVAGLRTRLQQLVPEAQLAGGDAAAGVPLLACAP